MKILGQNRLSNFLYHIECGMQSFLQLCSASESTYFLSGVIHVQKQTNPLRFTSFIYIRYRQVITSLLTSLIGHFNSISPLPAKSQRATLQVCTGFLNVYIHVRTSISTFNVMLTWLIICPWGGPNLKVLTQHSANGAPPIELYD